MKDLIYIVKDELGIHARPAELFVKEVSAFPCKITVAKGSREVDAKRILGVMSLAVKCGEEIRIKAEGEQEEEAIAGLKAFLEANL